MAAEGMLKRVVRGNWHLLLLMALILGAAVVFAVRPAKAADARALMANGEIGVELSGNDNGTSYKAESRWAQPTRDARFAEGIKKYEHELAYNPQSPETPANLYRLANLYYSLEDYKNASKYYVTLMQDYPRYEGIRYAYPNLVASYGKMGEHELRRNTIRQMMDYFGPETPEHKFAEQELGL